MAGIKVDDGGLCGNCNLGGIWDLGLQQQQQHVFAGKPVGKQQTGVNELDEGHTAGHHHDSLGTKRSSRIKQNKSH